MSKRQMPTGVRERHSRSCRVGKTGRCTCKRGPTYEAFVYHPREEAKIRKSFRTLSEAKRWRASATHALGRGQLKAPVRRTLREETEDWLEQAKRGVVLTRSEHPYKPSVLRTFEADLRRYVLPDLGGLRVSDVTRRDVQALVDRLRAGKRSGSKVRNIVVALKVVFRRVLENDELTGNPTTGLRLPPPAGTRDRVVTPEETSHLLDGLPEADRALWGCAVYGGLRRGEIRGLRWSDVDLASGIISVRRSWDEKDGEVLPKSSKGIREVPIAPVLRDLLAEHKARTNRSGEDFVFGSAADRPFTPTAVRRRALTAWKNWNEAENEKAETEGRDARLLVPVGLHECRHSFVSMMHDAGFSLEEIGDYVGHTSTFMTDRYRHLLPGSAGEAGRRFGDYLARANTLNRLAQLETGAQAGAHEQETASVSQKP